MVFGDAILWLLVQMITTHRFPGIPFFKISLKVLLNALECQLMCLLKEMFDFGTSFFFLKKLVRHFCWVRLCLVCKGIETPANRLHCWPHHIVLYIIFTNNINVWHLSRNPVGYTAFIFSKHKNVRLFRPACEVNCVKAFRWLHCNRKHLDGTAACKS
jgi:hypothetical protein